MQSKGVIVMKDSIKVARWEIKNILHSKTFIIMTFFVPIFILIIGGAVGYFSSANEDKNNLVFGVDNKSLVIGEEHLESLKNEYIDFRFFDNINKKEEMIELIEENELNGFLTIPNDILKTNTVEYYFNDLQGINTDSIRNLLSPLIVNLRISNSGFDVNKINNLTRELQINTTSLTSTSEGKESSSVIEMFLPFGLAMLMIFASFFSGASLMQSIIKEKSNKIVEIILSSIDAWDLMLGKVIGFGIVGLLQVSIWAVSALFVLKIIFDISFAFLFSIKIMYMLIYFILGFITIASINAIVGAGMKQAQSGSQSTGFLVMIPIIPLYFSSFIVNNTEGVFSYVFSYIPVTSATTMLIRLGFSDPPLVEVFGIMFLLLFANYLLIKLAAKIFRVGMLMYGKSANFKELFKWAKSKEY